MNKRFDKPNENNPIEQGLQRIHHHIFEWIFSDRCLSAKLNTHVYASMYIATKCYIYSKYSEKNS